LSRPTFPDAGQSPEVLIDVLPETFGKCFPFNLDGGLDERFDQLLRRPPRNNPDVGLMRLAVAEARRFPDLARTVSVSARQLSTEAAARHLGEMTQSDQLGSLPAFAPEGLATKARFFLDLVVVPFLLRALFEVNPKTLQAEIGSHVARSVAFFLAACRSGVS
jgi:AefR-like transcriptional repressor, C-terminal domain